MQWQRLLDDSGIEYVEKGPNTRRGEISVKCPWCGDDDPSQHLGISLTSTNWGCLRNMQHRGHKPIRLIIALLGVTLARAKLIEQQYNSTDPTGLDEALASLEGTPKRVKPPPAEKYPPITALQYGPLTRRFWRYLRDERGYGDDVREVIWRYNIGCCLTGSFKDRLIIPFYRQGNIIAWTGRAIINPVNAPRYLSSQLIKTIIFNEETVLRGGKLLFITEGPFDAMKVDFYSRGKARATCTSGTTVSLEQITLLRAAVKNFERVVLLFDRTALGEAFAAMDWLYAPNVVIGQLPTGAKDPGVLGPDQIQRLIQNTGVRS